MSSRSGRYGEYRDPWIVTVMNVLAACLTAAGLIVTVIDILHYVDGKPFTFGGIAMLGSALAMYLLITIASDIHLIAYHINKQNKGEGVTIVHRAHKDSNDVPEV